MPPPSFPASPGLTLGALLLGTALAAPASDSRAAAAAPAGTPPAGTPPADAAPAPAPTLDATASYKDVVLKDLVARSKTSIAGERIIFAPSPLRFRATLAALPAPQKADYLLTALGMMKIGNPPRVSQRIGLDYGGDKALAAYIDDAIAARLAKEVKVGESRVFYAFHVYNHNRGPALLITSFGE